MCHKFWVFPKFKINKMKIFVCPVGKFACLNWRHNLFLEIWTSFHCVILHNNIATHIFIENFTFPGWKFKLFAKFKPLLVGKTARFFLPPKRIFLNLETTNINVSLPLALHIFISKKQYFMGLFQVFTCVVGSLSFVAFNLLRLQSGKLLLIRAPKFEYLRLLLVNCQTAQLKSARSSQPYGFDRQETH